MSSLDRALPRRSSARWLEGAPVDVIGVYDNQGKTADRYSVLLREWHDHHSQLVGCLSLSDSPGHPMGVSQFCGAMRGPHLGRKISWGELPQEIRTHVAVRLAS